MSDIQQELASNLKRIRKEKGFSQAEVSKRSGVIASTYSRIETCIVSPNLSTLISLAKALEVPMSDLFQLGTLKDASLMEKLSLIERMSDYNRNVVEIMIDTVIEKDRLEKTQKVKMKKRLDELEQVKGK